ncbi:major facilitator superfamily domain-containing protein [Aspergillus karnatakaensis]|uniref:MFS transporter n=1 Tax=Aspergillus karnatakaensis TaxID=1810916 RepID=UPI003CCD8760
MTMESNELEKGLDRTGVSSDGSQAQPSSLDESSATELSSHTAQPTSHEPAEKASMLVDFDGPDDKLNPQNWSNMKKFYTVVLVSTATMIVAMTSSIFSTVIVPLSSIYGISREVGTLGVSLYVLGFATGPLVWAPFSELKGRRIPFVVGMFGFTVFSFATATAKDLQTIFICRFFAGFFGACPLTLSGAVNSDMLSPPVFIISMVGFVITVFSGPLLAPTIGGFTVMNEHLGWRWTHYITGLLGAASLISILFFLDESFAPVLLTSKARRLRHETQNWAIHAKHEELELSFSAILQDYLAIPLKMLALDPIILCMCIFGSFVYGLLYLFLTAYPITFQRIHGMNPGVGGLPFLAVIVGQFLAGLFFYVRQPWFMRKIKANKGQMVPEWLLLTAIPGSASFSAGLFWLGWTGYRRDIHWIAPTLSGLLTGFGLITMFLPSIQYVVQIRRERAASAIAAHTFLRSLAGSGFPLFASYMFDSLGVEWALTLLGCVSACLVPIPVILYIYGARIRAKSRLVL